MIRHIVVIKVSAADDAEKSENARFVASALGALEGRVPGLLSISVGIDNGGLTGHWDVALVTEHDTFEALGEYQVHPNHRAAVAAINPYVEARAVADYELVTP